MSWATWYCEETDLTHEDMISRAIWLCDNHLPQTPFLARCRTWLLKGYIREAAYKLQYFSNATDYRTGYGVFPKYRYLNGAYWLKLDKPQGYIIRGYDDTRLFSLEDCQQYIAKHPDYYVDWPAVEQFWQEHSNGMIYFS